MDEFSVHNIDVGDPELVHFHEGISSDAKDMEEIGSAMEVLTNLDLELAYSSEKLGNLENLLMHVLSWENDFEAMAADSISVECVEKALTFDLLSGILDSEVRELDSFMGSVQVALVDARHKISSCRHLGELFNVVEAKLYDSDESLKQSREHVLEMKMQLAKLQMTSIAFNRNDWIYNHSEGLSDNFQNKELKPQAQIFEVRHVLRMLEKSLGRELDLEKKLTESKQNEEDLKLKIRLKEQVAFFMEEAAEVVWGRFLEAENAAEVLMGISKEMVGQQQILQFSLNGFSQREDDLKSKLKDYVDQLNAKETSIQKFNNRIAELISDNSDVSALREKVNSLEEQLKESESQLKKANALNDESREQLQEMESIIESMKENVYAAEHRAEIAEEKVAHLTDTNMELTEELGFLKNSNDSSTKKVSVLEKQSRELELQLQQARASSEAGQEQQNMLYSAIWDMETLIDELKQKVSKAEVKTENAEEQCVMLSDTNLELTKELNFLRARVESLETSLSQANVEKIASAKDISIRTNLIMDMVVELATERERIKKQLCSLMEDKRILIEKLRQSKNSRGGAQDKNFALSGRDITNASSAEKLVELSTGITSKSIQAGG